MSKVNDGGAAFPVAVPVEFQFAEAGMSLRDWFAGQALQAIISKSPFCADDQSAGKWQRATAKGAYIYADAMLRARSESGR